MTATASRRSAPKSVKPTKSSFLTAAQIEDVDNDTKADDRYVSPSKLPEDKPQRFRIFGTGITGYEGWLEDGDRQKPIRWQELPDELPANLRTDDRGRKQIKRFIYAVVWDYQREKFSILQLTQVSLIRDLLSLINDEEDAGEPHLYDIKIVKTGTGLTTKYKLTGGQIKPPKAEIAAAYADLYCNLDAIFDNLDPWDANATAQGGDDLDDDDEDEEEGTSTSDDLDAIDLEDEEEDLD